MKALVAFFSRTGNTRLAASQIARLLDADIDEILDQKDRSGVKGWLGAGKDASQKNAAAIKYEKSPEKYDLVIVGTPIWAFTVTPAIRTYLSENKFKKVAFFSTSSGSGIERTFSEMEKASMKPVALLALKTGTWSTKLDLGKDDNLKKIDEFCRSLGKI